MTLLKLGIIGSGGIAHAHLRLLPEYDDVRLAAACDVVPERAERVAAAYGGKPYTDYKEMLDQEKLDALMVCVPPFAHDEIEERAAAKGMHLLVEKPLGLDMGMVGRKAEAIAKSGIITATGYSLRYAAGANKAKEILANQTIAMIRAQLLSGFVRTPWWGVYAKSGGQLVEQTTHSVDLIRYIAGDMHKVYADMAQIAMQNFAGADAPSVTSMNFVMKSGAVGHLDTSYISPDWVNQIEFLCKDFKVTLYHDKVEVAEREQITTYPVGGASTMKLQDRAFFDAIIAGNRKAIRSDYFDAMKTMEATVAANQSWETGSAIILTL